MLLGFSTNGIAGIDPFDAVPFLRRFGYGSLAITLDRRVLDPFARGLPQQIDRWRSALEAAGMACVVETGARYLLDPLVKHAPTLVSPEAEGRMRRVEFLVRAIDVARDLSAGCVSLWSGAATDGADEEMLWKRLVDGLLPVLDHADARGVTVGFEPEPGMFIDTLPRFGSLVERLERPERLGLTVDVGHLECMGERPASVLDAWGGRIVNVHVDDMLACRHEHLPLGDGDVAFGDVFAALAAGGYAGGLHVELPRQADRWADTARRSADFLRSLLEACDARRP